MASGRGGHVDAQRPYFQGVGKPSHGKAAVHHVEDLGGKEPVQVGMGDSWLNAVDTYAGSTQLGGQIAGKMV